MKCPALIPVDCSRGSPMGRDPLYVDGVAATLHLNQVVLHSGYDKGGAYWGIGESLWCAYDKAGTVEIYYRAYNRAEAKKKILAEFPLYKFYR